MTSIDTQFRKNSPRRRAADPAVYGRTRIANHTDVLPGIDGRNLIARRYRDIADAIALDQGGEDQCSESRKQLIRRFAASSVLAEQVEAALARGEEIDISSHALLCSTLVRLAGKLGINRVPKNVNDMASYLARRAALSTNEEPA
jgi:hypothetical protein